MKETNYTYMSRGEVYESYTATVFDNDCNRLEVGKLFVKYSSFAGGFNDTEDFNNHYVKGIPTDAVKQYVKQYPEHHYTIVEDKHGRTVVANVEFKRFAKVDGKEVVVFGYDYVNNKVIMKKREETKECEWQCKKGKMVPEIIISSDGEKVVEAKRVVEVNGEWEVVGKGVSRCHPLDKFSLKEGAKQALKRLFGVMEKEKEHTFEMFYKGKSYGKVGFPTLYRDSFSYDVLYTGDQVQVLRSGKAAKGVITKDGIITNDEIISYDTLVYATILKKHSDVKPNDVFAGVVYE